MQKNNMKPLLLNADLGEGFAYDADIMPLIDIANIACGEHAGNLSTVQRTVAMAVNAGVAVCAHPGYPDRKNFGRLSLTMNRDALFDTLELQLLRIQNALLTHGQTLRYIKPHGALYNDCANDAALSTRFVEFCLTQNKQLTIIGLAGSTLLEIAQAHGMAVYAEVFIDRRYMACGNLTPRHEPGACIEDIDQACAQATQLAKYGQVTTIDQQLISLPVDTLCIHGDTASALALAQRVAKILAPFRP
jgi:UPF0271 protein